jgi:hypothetical protein
MFPRRAGQCQGRRDRDARTRRWPPSGSHASRRLDTAEPSVPTCGDAPPRRSRADRRTLHRRRALRRPRPDRRPARRPRVRHTRRQPRDRGHPADPRRDRGGGESLRGVPLRGAPRLAPGAPRDARHHPLRRGRAGARRADAGRGADPTHVLPRSSGRRALRAEGRLSSARTSAAASGTRSTGSTSPPARSRRSPTASRATATRFARGSSPRVHVYAPDRTGHLAWT